MAPLATSAVRSEHPFADKHNILSPVYVHTFF